MLVAITSALVLQNTIYANFLLKYFHQVVQYDASHFGAKGQIININSKGLKGSANQITEKANININDFDPKNIEIAKIGSARNQLIFSYLNLL